MNMPWTRMTLMAVTALALALGTASTAHADFYGPFPDAAACESARKAIQSGTHTGEDGETEFTGFYTCSRAGDGNWYVDGPA
ncbi:hypothetical protein [Nocardia wallacei]|uniref:hypothetical protein n=1 Tax=Nocardia wallacei TaxID=480035 RepID=UPI00245514C1|nr:hypothetical protein [Nocardia wallacei]